MVKLHRVVLANGCLKYNKHRLCGLVSITGPMHSDIILHIHAQVHIFPPSSEAMETKRNIFSDTPLMSSPPLVH